MDYPLQTLLELRERAAETADADVARQVAVVAEMKGRLQAMREHAASLRDSSQQQRVVATASISGAQIRAVTEYRSALVAEAETTATKADALFADLQEEEAKLAELRAIQASAHADVAVVQKHKDAWVEDRNSVRAKKAADELDDIALRKWMEMRRE